jgi:hypothetical protein
MSANIYQTTQSVASRNVVAKSSFISVPKTTRHQTPCQMNAVRFLKPDLRYGLAWHGIHDCLPPNVLLLLYQSNEVNGYVTLFSNYTKPPGQLIWSNVHQWLRKETLHLPGHLACTFCSYKSSHYEVYNLCRCMIVSNANLRFVFEQRIHLSSVHLGTLHMQIHSLHLLSSNSCILNFWMSFENGSR